MNLLRHAYDMLDLSMDATPREVHRAYRELVKVWHPDRFGDDPRLQKRAQEKLKEINEAYAVVREDLSSRALRPEVPDGTPSSVTPTPASATVIQTPKPEKRSNIRKAPAAWPSFDAAPLIPFFSSWQNLIFLILVFAALHHTTLRYGSIFAGAGYALKILSLPLMFALICNLSRLASLRLLWGAYVAVVSLSGGLLMVDAISFSKELHEAALYRSATPLDRGSGFGEYPGLPAGSSPGPFSVSAKGGQASGGPLAPVPPQVRAPDAPLAPSAPIVPAAPEALPAR